MQDDKYVMVFGTLVPKGKMTAALFLAKLQFVHTISGYLKNMAVVHVLYGA